MKALARFWRERDGVVAVEAAIIMPAIIILMAVTFEMGAAQMAKGAVVFATQQAAVVQSTGGDPHAIFAQNVAGTGASAGTVTCSTSNGQAKCTGSANFANAFAGVLGAPATLALSYTAAVQVPQ